MQILTVDDSGFDLRVIERALAELGHNAVPAHGAEQALSILRRGEIRLVITDWEMPGMNGLDLCRALRAEDFNGYIYLIMLTGNEGSRSRREGLAAGADAFLNKPLDVDELEVCLKTAERILALETRDVALFALAKLAESRDPEVGGHIERVQSYTRLLAQHLSPAVKAQHGVDAEYIRLLYQTSPLHDLGKVGIPDGVLLKPGKLTPEEFEVMKTHTTLGARTLEAALQRFPGVRFLQMARDIAISHHEKFDGSGYPLGLAGERIPLCGRIVAVADVYDALTSRRVYKNAIAHDESRQIIERERGRHFDPDVVDAFIAAEKQIIAVQARLKDEAATVEVSAEVSGEVSAPPSAERRGALCADPQEAGGAVTRLQEANTRLAELNGRLERLSITDELTGLFNRRHAMVRLEEQWSLAERYGRPLTVAMVDIDHFKHVNDAFGHDAGDLVLRRVAAILRDKTRITDAVCRIGGEEFLIIFPAESVEEAAACCQRFRAAIEAHAFPVGDSRVRVTISAGVASRSGELAPGTAQFPDLLREADKALYAAKNSGRNRVVIADDRQKQPHGHHDLELKNQAINQQNWEVDMKAINQIRVNTSSEMSEPAAKAAAQVTAQVGGQATAARPPIRWTAVVERCGGDASFAAAVAGRFASQGPAELDKIESAVAAADLDLLRRAAHTLKGMSAYLAAQEIADNCVKIEQFARDGDLASAKPVAAELRGQLQQSVDWLADNVLSPAAAEPALAGRAA